MHLLYSLNLKGAAFTISCFLLVSCVLSVEITNDTAILLNSGQNYGGQQIMAYSGGEGSEDAGLGYLKRSIQFELKRRLSSKAKLVIEGEDGFQHVNARYSDYKRPWYIAGVRVANEADAIETVRLDPKLTPLGV